MEEHVWPDSRCGAKRARRLKHKAVILITLVGSLITILVFLTGKNLPDYLVPFTRSDQAREATTKPQHTDGRRAPQQETVKEPPAATPPGGPSVESSGTTTSAVPSRRGIHPVGRGFIQGTGLGVGKVHLFNIEIVEGRFLQFNFDFNWETGFTYPVDVNLDNPVDTTFLVDSLGRQHPLVQATGISADRPTRVSPGSSKRFTLTFPFPSEMESFKYQAALLMRIGNPLPGGPDVQSRLHIRSEEGINLTDFR